MANGSRFIFFPQVEAPCLTRQVAEANTAAALGEAEKEEKCSWRNQIPDRKLLLTPRPLHKKSLSFKKVVVIQEN